MAINYLSESEKIDLETRLSATMRFTMKDNSSRVLAARYLKSTLGEETEKPEEMFARIAVDIASAERQYKPGCDVYPVAREFYEAMVQSKFIPNSPTLMNAGRRTEQQLAACFVLPIEDKFGDENSTDGIWDTYKDMALVHQSGGGTGFSFGRLRPRGSTVLQKEDFYGVDKTEEESLNLKEKSIFWLKSQGVASGPLSFLRVYNTATDVIKQGGTRRGANMAILPVYHPDSLDFIHAKDRVGDITNFNLSIGIDEEFMRLVEENGYFRFKNPHTKRNLNKREIASESEFKKLKEKDMVLPCIYSRGQDIVDAYSGKVVGKIGKLVDAEPQLSAKAFFDLIVEGTWKTGDPGVIFLDRLNKANPTPALGEIEATNPCGEQPLLPYEACNLGSINLNKFVSDGNIDYAYLERIVHTTVRFLDNVIDRSDYPLKAIRDMVKGNRKIGLGVMGLADMLIALKLSYSSEEARQKTAEVMEFIDRESKKASAELAKEKGEFPNWEQSVWANGGLAKYGLDGKLRNATTTTIAPTGTISLIASCSSGIEPLFGVAFKRTVMDRDVLPEINEQFEKIARERGFFSPQILEQIVSGQNRGSIQKIEEIPEDIKKVFKTTLDVHYAEQLKMQNALQSHVDNAVSKTINLRNEATIEDVANAYMLIYKLGGIKGATLFRDQCRGEHQVISFSEEEERGIPKKRQREMPGSTIEMKTGCGNLFVTINRDEKGKPFEAFATMGKAGGCEASQMEAVGRLVSYSLRIGGNPEEIVGQLLGIRCNRPHPTTPCLPSKKCESCSDAIAKALAYYIGRDVDEFHKIGNSEKEEKFDSEDFDSPFKPQTSENSRIKKRIGGCPSCGGELTMAEGCRGGICLRCGHSECG